MKCLTIMYFLTEHPAGSFHIRAESVVIILATEKEHALRSVLSGMERIIVAYSGGLDSALLAAIAREELGERARIILLDSPLLPRRQLREARERASALGIPLTIIPFPVLDDAGFRRNLKDRCYRCKKHACRILRDVAAECDAGAVIDGVNTSDLGEFRPGLRACREEGIIHPYLGCGISKEDIRDIARSHGVAFWNCPPSTCLASRLPYGDEISTVRLRAIEAGEDLLYSFGLRQVRLRSHGDLARIEILPSEFSLLLSHREEIAAGLRAAGYRYITLDIEGFRTGSMDESPAGESTNATCHDNP